MKPLLVTPKQIPTGLERTTWEERRKMTVKELIVAMGSSHVNHKDFVQKEKPPLLRMENLAGKRVVFADTDPGFWQLVCQLFRWMAR